ncbi:histidine kinase [Clostridium sp. AN503]|uniref:sensor histidine kinase n=1 Tax=Clostridium sp. AN503 TaxID=3160598 RepID=UPI00345A8063
MERDVFQQNGSNKNPIRFSINKKILMLSAAIVLPFLIMVVVLLVSMIKYSRTYDSLVSNLTIANNYNLNFKEDMDESLYKLVVGYVDFENISEDGTLKDPYALIGELRGEFTTLRDYTTEAESRMWLESLLRNIDTLEKRVDDILENIKIGGRYDENIQELDNNIYILTELIQDNIQYYIYYQTKSMEAVTGDLNQQIQSFLVVCGLLVFLLVILTIIVTYLITADILRPVKVLYEATQKVSEGDLSARADIHSRDEIEILAGGFNDMAENLQLLIKRTKEDEQKMRKLDLRLLQEQINPHFLYNTLDTIVWLIECNKADEAVNMVVTLSDFFRLVLSKGKEIISLKEEQQHIRSYLEIQEVRYRDILEYHIQIDPGLYDYQILKLTLQPLVENALYHGIKYKRAKGAIRIRVEKREDILYLTVSDDGIGMDKEELAQLRKEVERPCNETEKGFGLANVNERIRMYFGVDYGMKIESEKGEGTTVTLTIPAIKVAEGRRIAEGQRTGG